MKPKRPKKDDPKDVLRQKFVMYYCWGDSFGNQSASMRKARQELGLQPLESAGSMGGACRSMMTDDRTQELIAEYRRSIVESESHLILTAQEALHRLSQIAMGSLEGQVWMTEKGALVQKPVSPSFGDQRAALDTILKWWSLGETEEARTIAEFNRMWDEGLVNLTPDLRDAIANSRDARALARMLMPIVDQARYEMRQKKMSAVDGEAN